jgi:CheY-like chemotaxis protein
MEDTLVAKPDRPRILVVDDEPGILFALEDQLEADFEVVATQSPELALGLAEKDASIAVVVSDQRMPGMQGDELLAKLRARSRATRILCSGYADVHAVLRCINDAGISAFITKPWDAATLHAKVREGVERFRLGREAEETRRLFAAMLTSPSRALFFKDLELRHVRASARYLRWLGLTDEKQLRGWRVTDLLPDWSGGAELEDAERQLLASPEGGPVVVQVRAPAGGEAYGELGLSVLRSEAGEAEGVLGVLQLDGAAVRLAGTVHSPGQRC